MRNDKYISDIKTFLMTPGVKSQAQVNAFLDSCKSLLASAKSANFGLSSTKDPRPEEVAAYYRNFMPILKVKLSLRLSASQLNDSAAHVVSLASAISADLSSHKLSPEQQEKLNGLAAFLTKLADVVCEKIDNRSMYRQFTEPYRVLLQRYLNAIPLGEAGLFSSHERVDDKKEGKSQVQKRNFIGEFFSRRDESDKDKVDADSKKGKWHRLW